MGNAISRTPAEAWAAALDGTARRLEESASGVVLFQEEREDLRAEGDPRGVETLHTRAAGASVRLVGSGRSAFLSEARPEDLDRLVRAAEAAEPPALPGAAILEGDGAILDGRRAGRVVRSLVAAALAERGGPEIVSVRAAYVAVRQTVRVARSDQGTRTDERRGERIRVEVVVRSGTQQGRALGERVLRPGREQRLEEFARGVTLRAAARLGALAARPGNCSAILAPGIAGVLVHEIVGHALEADVVSRGASRLAAESGTVAASAVRVFDDPRRARVPWRIDDEGCEARAVSLVEGGRVAGRIHDRASAEAAGERPTGHGRCASFRDPVLPRMGCTFLAAGSASVSDVFEDVRDGVIIRRMEAATTDPSTGHAVFRVTDGDRVIAGRVAEPLEPFHFAVEAIPALRALDLVADDLEFDTCVGSCARGGQPLAISVGAPTCRLGLIKVLG